MNITVTLEQAKRLKKLGRNKETFFKRAGESIGEKYESWRLTHWTSKEDFEREKSERLGIDSYTDGIEICSGVEELYKAPTAHELLAVIPQQIPRYRCLCIEVNKDRETGKISYSAYYEDSELYCKGLQQGPTLARALGDLTIWLCENGYLSFNSLNDNI